MTKAARKMLSILVGLFMLAGLYTMAVPPEPASAATKLTISVSGNVDQDVLDSFIERIIDVYNLEPDEIYIRYPDGTTKQYNPDSNVEPPAAPAPQPQPQPQPSEPKPQPSPAPDTSALNADEQRMLQLVNQERAAAGLAPLKANMELVRLARLKAQDMIKLNYFSHTSPTYGSPFDMIKSAGISYRYAGENLAGAYSVDVAHTNLMNSPGHRANILNANFKEVGIGVINGGPYGKMFVQMFIG